MPNSPVNRGLLQSAAAKLGRGEPLTNAEKQAHARWKAAQEAEWREKIYRDVPLKDVKRLLGGRTTKFVNDFATSTGLPIAGASSDLFAVFAVLVDFARKLPGDHAPPEGGTTNGGGLVCHTMFSAAEALKARIGRGSVRMLRDWIKQGMPGKPGGRGVQGHFPIDEMAEWAKNNLDDLKVETDEGSLLTLELKRQKVRQETLNTEDKEQDREERRGNILPRDEHTQFIRDSVVVARQQLLALPKELAGLISEPKLQRTFLDESTKRITTILEGLANEFARGPDSANETVA